jgi:hypothetical protein
LCSAPCPPCEKLRASPFKAHVTTYPYARDWIDGPATGLFSYPTLGEIPPCREFGRVDHFIDRRISGKLRGVMLCVGRLFARLIGQHVGNTPKMQFRITTLQPNTGYANPCLFEDRLVECDGQRSCLPLLHSRSPTPSSRKDAADSQSST